MDDRGDDVGVERGVEVFDLDVVVSAGALVGFAFCSVLELMKNCGTWASVSLFRSPKSCCDSSLK